MIFFLLIGFALGAGVIIFALQNTEVVALTFLGWQFESSLALVILLAIALGVVISALASLPSAIGSGIRHMGLRKENTNLRRSLDEAERINDVGVVVVETETEPKAF